MKELFWWLCVVQRHWKVLQMRADSVNFTPGGGVKLWFTVKIVRALRVLGTLRVVEAEPAFPWLCSHCTIRRLFTHISILQPGTKSIKSVWASSELYVTKINIQGCCASPLLKVSPELAALNIRKKIMGRRVCVFSLVNCLKIVLYEGGVYTYVINEHERSEQPAIKSVSYKSWVVCAR